MPLVTWALWRPRESPESGAIIPAKGPDEAAGVATVICRECKSVSDRVLKNGNFRLFHENLNENKRELWLACQFSEKIFLNIFLNHPWNFEPWNWHQDHGFVAENKKNGKTYIFSSHDSILRHIIGDHFLAEFQAHVITQKRVELSSRGFISGR